MALFDQFDRIAAEAIGEVHNEPVIWRPMAKDASPYTGGDAIPDPARPVRNILAAVSWRPTNVPVGTTDDTGAVVTADCVIDVDSEVFKLPDGSWGPLPVKGDIFELAEEYVGNNLVRVDKSGDDGSARLLYQCTIHDAT